MSANVARELRPVDALEVQVLVDNVTDSLSTVPKDVTNEGTVLVRNGTGWRAVHALANIYGDDVLVPSAVGRQFAF